jgi:sterol 3beta-glucosyltransferase
VPIAYGYSPVVLPKPVDWGDWIHVTGYWFLDAPARWQPPVPLVDFLQSGPPPIYIGLGSMSEREPEETTKMLLHALSLTGQRAVLASGWSGLGNQMLPDNVFRIEAIPHDWLFPQMAAVVHHGGCGTTAAGLRAGVPTVTIPFFADQPFWAQRAFELGMGPRPIPRTRLTAEKLAVAIQAAVADKPMRTSSESIGKQIRAENGVSNAVEVFERATGR